MSDNTQAPEADTSEEQGPQLRLLTQYVKDFSFENPNAPASLQSGEAPAIDLEIGVSAHTAQENIYEVSLSVTIKATREENTVFLLELVYAGLFMVSGIEEENMGPVLHIECTRLIFPFVRRIISDMTQDGGFPALPLELIDFAAVYRAGLEQQAAQQASDKNGSGDAPAGET
ncbi:MAG: protein-export chaperone SecB [Robiginitomaculum sp.]|nr:MAG: protein-export chaperone SecB [Robiginitomaculum sp.]